MVQWVKQFGRSFGDLLWNAWIEYERDRAKYFAVAMIYYAIVSLVPFLSLLLSSLGLLLRFSSTAAAFQQQTMMTLEANLGLKFREMIETLLATLEKESIIATVISLFGLLLAASILFHHLRLSFRALWHYDPPLISGSVQSAVKATIRERAVSVGMVLGGGGLLVIAIGVNAAIQWLDRLLGSLLQYGQGSIWWLGILSSFVLDMITFTLLFKFLPPVPIRFRDAWPAALICAFSWVVASKGLALYRVLFGNSNSAYGALGGLLAILLWMKLVSNILFFGAELCKVSIQRAKSPVHPTTETAHGEPYPI